MLAAAISGCPDDSAQTGANRPAIVTIDEQTIFLDDFLHAFKTRGPGAELDPATDPATLRQLQQRFLEEEIERVLLLKEASRLGIEVEAGAVDAEMAKIRADYPGEKFRLMLATRSLTPDALRASIEEKLKLDALLARLLKDKIALVTEAEVEAFYGVHREEFHTPARVKMRQIVVPTGEEARRVREEILVGLDFSEAARRYSTTPDAAHGGDLGYFAKGVMPSVFDEYGFEAKPGLVSQVVESEYGYHLFLVLDRIEPAEQPLDEVRELIRRRLTAQRAERAREDFLAGLVTSHRILRQPEVLGPTPGADHRGAP